MTTRIRKTVQVRLNARLVKWIDDHHEELGFNNRSDLMRYAIRDFVMHQRGLKLPELASASAKDHLPDDAHEDEDTSVRGTALEGTPEEAEQQDQEPESNGSPLSSESMTDVVQQVQDELLQQRVDTNIIEWYGEGRILSHGYVSFSFTTNQIFIDHQIHPIAIPMDKFHELSKLITGRHEVRIVINDIDFLEHSGSLIISDVGDEYKGFIFIHSKGFNEHKGMFHVDQILDIGIDIDDKIIISISK